MKAFGIVPLLLVLSCEDEETGTYVQFNNSEDTMVIYVGSEIMDPHTVELTSSTGDNIVGQATVNPQGGPCGTEHTITVVVNDAYEDQVSRVTVLTDSGDRGQDEYDLEQDSADEGYFKLDLQSSGEDGETREDILSFRLYEFVEDSG